MTMAGVESGRRAVLVDSGVIVAILDRDEPLHAAATSWLARVSGTLHTVESVLSEVSFLVPARVRSAVASLVARGTLSLHSPDAAGCARMAELFDKYCDVNPDWADVSLIWLAESLGARRIATLDVRDFSIYRIHGRKRFELEML